MIFKTSESAVRINGVRSLLLCDNLICFSLAKHDYQDLAELASPEQALCVFRGLLGALTTDRVFCLYDDDYWCVSPTSTSKGKDTFAYVCYDGMLVRIDDVDRINIDADGRCVTLSFPDGGVFCYDFLSQEEAILAFDSMVSQIQKSGVLLLERRGDDELMAYHI